MESDRKKRLLIVNNNMDLGGVQRALINLLVELEGRADITLFLFSFKGDYIDQIPEHVTVLEAGGLLRLLGLSQKEARSMGWIYYGLRGVLSMYTKLFNNHWPIRFLVHSHPMLSGYDAGISFLHNVEGHLLYGGCNDFVLRRVQATRKITFLHCDFLACGSNTKYSRKLMDRFDRIAVVSEGCKRSFLAAMPDLEGRTSIVPNCHNIPEYRRKAEEDPIIYLKEAFNVVTIARMDAGKGILRGVTAMDRLIQDGEQIQWHLVGGGALESSIKEEVHRRGLEDRIRFYGDQNNPYRFLKNADLLLLPSIHEAAPMVIMEAKSLGVPVLSTDTISAKEMIIEGKEGFVCPNNEEGIYQDLRKILLNLQTLQECRDFLRKQNYSNDDALRHFEELIT